MSIFRLDSQSRQWYKAFMLVLFLMFFMTLAHATDSTGVTTLDDPASTFQKGVQMFAKWAGIIAIVGGGYMLGSGEARGQAAKVIFGIVLMIGFIMAAWGWFSSNFTYGFDLGMVLR